MARLSAGQRVVRSVPDRQGNVYTKTSAGGKARASGAVRYIDQHEQTALYKLEEGQVIQTDREAAVQQIEASEAKYVQHMAFTTTLRGEVADAAGAAQQIAQAIQERRPDAEIYALAVHQGRDLTDPNVHVHVVFGTGTTLRQRGQGSDLTHFKEAAYQLEQRLTLERGYSLNHDQQGEKPQGDGGRMPLLEQEDAYQPERERQKERQHEQDYGMDY